MKTSLSLFPSVFMTTIHFANVYKQYSNAPRPAVDGVDFEVAEGSFVVLLGPSGCGKTTLLKMVNRLIEPTSGTIWLGGQDIRQVEPVQLRRQIGYVIQQIGLFPHMSVAQNVAVVPSLLGWEPERIRQRVDALLELVDLPPDEYRERYPAQMSGGQWQRVGVARALAGDPGLILMDEPFGAVDAITRTGLQNALLDLQRKLKKTILFVTHDVEEALRLADRIVVMRAGKVVQYDAPFDLLRRPADEFVHALIGADDIVRQLSMLRVAAAMEPIPPHFQPDGHPTVSCDENLRQALSLLLRTDQHALIVLEQDKPVGLLTLRGIQLTAG